MDGCCPGLDVQAYVSDAHIPTSEDFRGFRREVKEWRRIYEANRRHWEAIFKRKIARRRRHPSSH